MTEAEWLACTDPGPMLNFLESRKSSKRKLRLCACGCCRRIWSALQNGVSWQAIEAAERFADREASDAQRAEAQDKTEGGICIGGDTIVNPAHLVACPTRKLSVWHSAFYCRWVVEASPGSGEARLSAKEREEAAQSDLVRCVFGNPFRPIAVEPAWQSSTVLSLAQAAYEHRELPSGELNAACLAVLSDALEEAGCTDADLLSHLRSPGPHVRGCWAVDLVLGKS